MKTFSYEIKDAQGIHARPAGLLVKEAKKYESAITMAANGKEVSATKLMAVMSCGVKAGQVVEFKVEGADEEAAAAGMLAFLEANL